MLIIAKRLIPILVYYTLLIFMQIRDSITCDDSLLIDYERCGSASIYDFRQLPNVISPKFCRTWQGAAFFILQ